MGWLYVGVVLTRLRLKVKPGWSGHMTMEVSGEAGFLKKVVLVVLYKTSYQHTIIFFN